jgi:glycosyltransferase involved in cell wall biosynthesis
MDGASYPRLSIVVPIHNEQENLPELYHRIRQAMETWENSYELILVNDGSNDRSLDIIRSLHENDPRVKYLSLSRNFGHQVAITAGLDFASGEAVLVMDGDLQDPPELIPTLVTKWQEGFDVVYAVREEREETSPYRQFIYRIFYRLLRRLARVDIPLDAGDFRLMSRRVVESLKKMSERNRFVRGLTAWVGFKQTGISYIRPARHAGVTKYSWAKLWRLALDGLVSFSFIPLQLATWFGFVVSGLCALYTSYLFYVRIFSNSPPVGWTSIMVALLFLGGVQLLTLGIIGEYIGRIFDEVKQRPLYLVGELKGFEERQVVTNGRFSPGLEERERVYRKEHLQSRECHEEL